MPLELAHQIGWVPVVAMMALRVRVGRKLPGLLWLVAWAFFVSWPADSVSNKVDTWAIDYVWIPIQIGMVLVALKRGTWAIALLCFAPVAWYITGPGPDFLLSFLGSVAILRLARGWLALPLHIYFGAGTFAYLLFVYHIKGCDLDAVSRCLDIYQGCRALAYVAFIGIITPQVIRYRRARQ